MSDDCMLKICSGSILKLKIFVIKQLLIINLNPPENKILQIKDNSFMHNFLQGMDLFFIFFFFREFHI